MTKMIEVPESLLKSLARAADAFERLEDELEDYLIGRDEKLLARLLKARRQHLDGDTTSLEELKKELCIE